MKDLRRVLSSEEMVEVEPPRHPGWGRPLVLAFAIALALLLAVVFRLDRKLILMRGWIDGLGPWGPLVYGAIYAIVIVAAVPSSPLAVGAGILFGAVKGVIVVSLASTAGAAIAFLLARHMARDAVVRWLGRNAHFRRLEALTEQHGAIVVALARLIPISPTNLVNYCFGLTSVSFPTYVLWTWLSFLPLDILVVAGTDTLSTGIAEGTIPWRSATAFICAALVMGVLIFFARKVLVRYGRRHPPDRVPESRTR